MPLFFESINNYQYLVVMDLIIAFNRRKGLTLLKKAIRCHLPSVLDSWDSTALVIKSKPSTFIQNKAEMSGKVKICAEVTVIFSELKESY